MDTFQAENLYLSIVVFFDKTFCSVIDAFAKFAVGIRGSRTLKFAIENLSIPPELFASVGSSAHSKFLGLHFQPFDSTPTTLNRAKRGTSPVT